MAIGVIFAVDKNMVENKGIRFGNPDGLEIVESFIRLYGRAVSSVAPHFEGVIVFRKLSRQDNQYDDIMGRIGKTIYISEEEVGKLGLSYPEFLAAIAHEVGHVVYSTRGWDMDCEQRADSMAAELGLGTQMISAIEKILASRRFRNLTSLLVGRIHFLQNMLRS